MKTLDVEQFRANFDQYLAEAENEDIVVTVDGEARIVVQGIAEFDFARSPEFWKMIQERRENSKLVSWEEAERRLDAKE
jgi:prevent-host-death family protein